MPALDARAATGADVEISGPQGANALGLDVDTCRELMQQGRVPILCERGVGVDDGRFRATFHVDGRRARLVLGPDRWAAAPAGEAVGA